MFTEYEASIFASINSGIWNKCLSKSHVQIINIDFGVLIDFYNTVIYLVACKNYTDHQRTIYQYYIYGSIFHLVWYHNLFRRMLGFVRRGPGIAHERKLLNTPNSHIAYHVFPLTTNLFSTIEWIRIQNNASYWQ